MKAHKKSKVSDPPLMPSFQRTLTRHLSKFPQPFRACSCLTIENGQVKLAVRFAANASSWSHVAHATTLADAFRRTRHQLVKDFRMLGPDPVLAKCGLGSDRSCGIHSCANASRCPNLREDSPFIEVARVDYTKDSSGGEES